MNNKSISNYLLKLKEIFPFLSDLLDNNIVSEKELIHQFQRYVSELDNRQDCGSYQQFNDWVVSALSGNKKAESFLKFYNNALQELYSLYNKNFPHQIIVKIRNSILETPDDKYKDSIGELLAILFLLKQSNYEYLDIEFKLGNGKDVDIAFKKDSSIQLIEIKNLHHLAGKNVNESIKNKIKSKLADKTKYLPQIEKYFVNNYPNYDVTLSILLFIWEDYANITSLKAINDEIKKAINDDFLPPLTIINQELENGEYQWQISDLENAIQMYRDDNDVESLYVNDQKEDVLSRRSFFKKTAGMVIPMLGAILFSGIPRISNAFNNQRNINASATSIPMNCNGSCSGSCSGDCSGSCSSGCSGGCGVACSGYCDNSCGRGCSSACRGRCQGTCTAQCRDGCTSCKGKCTQLCLSGCGRACSKNCVLMCKTVCEEGCKDGCQIGCTNSCSSDCNGGCTFGCKYSCGSGCSDGCRGTCEMGCNSMNYSYIAY